MTKCKRKSIGTHFSSCVQPAFIIGTNNEDGSYEFAPITWVSATNDKDWDYHMTVSMYGTKRTKTNALREKKLSINLVSTDMLRLMDYLGTHKGKNGKKDAIPYEVSRGEVVDVPVLEASRWVYECEVVKTVELGGSTTFFCKIMNIQVDERLDPKDTFDVDISLLDPVIYSSYYYKLGEKLGQIGEMSEDIKD